jgi:hypothetical protein
MTMPSGGDHAIDSDSYSVVVAVVLVMAISMLMVCVVIISTVTSIVLTNTVWIYSENYIIPLILAPMPIMIATTMAANRLLRLRQFGL